MVFVFLTEKEVPICLQVSTVFLFCTGVRKLQLHHGTAFRVMRGADVHTQMSISARCRVIVRSKLGQIQRGITEGMWKKRMLQHSGNQDNSSQIFWQHVRTAVYFFLVAPGLNKSQRKCEKFKQRARRWLTYLEEVAR
jgi:hypothetical protein